jgi:hypothetical protein
MAAEAFPIAPIPAINTRHKPTSRSLCAHNSRVRLKPHFLVEHLYNPAVHHMEWQPICLVGLL